MLALTVVTLYHLSPMLISTTVNQISTQITSYSLSPLAGTARSRIAWHTRKDRTNPRVARIECYSAAVIELIPGGKEDVCVLSPYLLLLSTQLDERTSERNAGWLADVLLSVPAVRAIGRDAFRKK